MKKYLSYYEHDIILNVEHDCIVSIFVLIFPEEIIVIQYQTSYIL